MEFLNNSVKKFEVILVILLVIFSFVNCSHANQKVLESDSTFGLSVRQNGNVVVMKGLCGHSAYEVKKIYHRNTKNGINIAIHIGLSEDGDSGSFLHEIQVTPEINEITFGKKKTIVWKRS